MNKLMRALQIFADHYDAKSLRKKPISTPMPKSKKDTEKEEEHKDLKSKPMPKAEIKNRKMAKDHLSGGLADGMDDDEFDEKQLDMGEQVEYEHTNDREISREISKDHLYEISDYYSRLADMEAGAEKDGKLNEAAEEKLDEKAETRKNAGFIVLCHRCNEDECECPETCTVCLESKDVCQCVCTDCQKSPELCSCGDDEEDDIEELIDPDFCDECDLPVSKCTCSRCSECCELENKCKCEKE